MNLALMLRRTANGYGDRPAVVLPDKTATWADLYARACRLAQALGAWGVGAGDRVASLGDNSGELLEIVAGCALGNFARAALYPYHSPEVNGYLLDQIGAKAVIVERKYYESLLPELVVRPHLSVVVIGNAPDSVISYEELLASAEAADPDVPIADDDVHIIRFSSGTTGKPKAIWHSNARWRGQSADFAAILPTMDERDRFLAAGSMTHICVGNLWQIIQSGASVVPMASFDAGDALRLIEHHKITYAVAPPVMLKAMIEHPSVGSGDLKSLRCLWYSGSPIAETTFEGAVKYFGHALYQVYGSSESAPMTVLRPHEHVAVPGSSRHRSAGRPTHNVDLTIRDDDGHRLPVGEIGEVATRSHGTMSGLWNDPDGTRARTLPDGSVLTRDVGYFDREGYLHLVDRKDDMIVSGGYNIWPAEIEIALVAHPAVREACVVGVPHPRWGETPMAAVVLVEGAQAPAADELIAFAREHVGGVKKPTRIEFVPELPRNGNGKVLRRLLRDRYVGETARIGGS
jgi:acyl-coenzyme A synthetase/AMP-(fatty) acid ligase